MYFPVFCTVNAIASVQFYNNVKVQKTLSKLSKRIEACTKPSVTYSKSTMETTEQSMKSVQSEQ